jgi:adenylate cyclase
MRQRFYKWLISYSASIGADPRDTDEVHRQKTLLVATSLLLLLPGALWGIMYIALGEVSAGLIPIGYVPLSIASMLVFARVRSYPLFRTSQLLLILLLPFLLQIALGGFISSSAVVLWSLISPIGGLVFGSPREAVRWFMGYLALVAVSGIWQMYAGTASHLSPGLVTLFFVLNIGMVSAIVFILLAYYIGERATAFKLLRVEQEKSDNLLLNILPREIAEILKNRGGTIADQYDNVSILFADIVNFTPLSAALSARQVVETLNEIFTYFDALVDKFGVEKIETVGDEYMAACGVPRACPDHAQSLARMALKMCEYIAVLPPREGRRLDIRIGIHSGPIVAGVIGRKKFAFELFGDTVNTASRMQSHGVPGKIHISQTTYELLKDDFICEPRGKVEIKGKGAMETWFVVGAK